MKNATAITSFTFQDKTIH